MGIRVKLFSLTPIKRSNCPYLSSIKICWSREAGFSPEVTSPAQRDAVLRGPVVLRPQRHRG